MGQGVLMNARVTIRLGFFLRIFAILAISELVTRYLSLNEDDLWQLDVVFVEGNRV